MFGLLTSTPLQKRSFYYNSETFLRAIVEGQELSHLRNIMFFPEGSLDFKEVFSRVFFAGISGPRVDMVACVLSLLLSW